MSPIEEEIRSCLAAVQPIRQRWQELLWLLDVHENLLNTRGGSNVKQTRALVHKSLSDMRAVDITLTWCREALESTPMTLFKEMEWEGVERQRFSVCKAFLEQHMEQRITSGLHVVMTLVKEENQRCCAFDSYPVAVDPSEAYMSSASTPSSAELHLSRPLPTPQDSPSALPRE
jgi:hypothetical protein